MENKTELGLNKTGIQMSPFDSKETIAFAQQIPPDIQGKGEMLEEVFKSCVLTANPIGSVPLPGTLAGMLKTLYEKVGNAHIEIFIDKIGERIAFERTGVRLYDAMIRKFSAFENMDEEIAIFRQFRAEEAEHLKIVTQAMIKMGGDPTAQTPCADVISTASSGILKVITDPRTDAPQSLEALLTAELTDTVSWELLVKMAELMEQDELVNLFTHALKQENHHQITIKKLLLVALKLDK